MISIVLIVFFSLLAILLLMALIMEKKYTIFSEVIIEKPKQEVFDFIIKLKNQDKYSKWVMADPNAKMTFTGNDGTIGFISKWDSKLKNVGAGEQEIKKIFLGKGYEVEIRFERPFKGISTAVTNAEAISENQTKFTTTFYTETPFPMNIMIPMIKNMLKKDMDENSTNLKNILERN